MPETLPLPAAPSGPHAGATVHLADRWPAHPRAAMVLVHGRGGSARDMLALARELGVPDVICVAPQAVGHTWYPARFTAPFEANEPFLSSALALLEAIGDALAAREVPRERQILLGFSQGACLALESFARGGRRLGAVAGLSGGLIGPPGTTWPFPATLDGTPVFLGCSVPDPHIDEPRLRESADVLERLGARVTLRTYPGLGHTVNRDELDVVRAMVSAVGDSG